MTLDELRRLLVDELRQLDEAAWRKVCGTCTDADAALALLQQRSRCKLHDGTLPLITPFQADKIRAGAVAALAKTRRWGPQIQSVDTVAQLRTHLVLYPQGALFDEAFLHHLLTHKADWQLQLCFTVNRHCPVLAMDMNNDGQVEYLVFSIESGANHNAAVFSRQPAWRRVGWLNRLSDGSGESLEQLEQALARGDVATVSSPWRDLRVGRFRQEFNEE